MEKATASKSAIRARRIVQLAQVMFAILGLALAVAWVLRPNLVKPILAIMGGLSLLVIREKFFKMEGLSPMPIGRGMGKLFRDRRKSKQS